MCLTKPLPSTKTMPGAPPRPYTTYNIFFQLEREYILQHDLNVTPKLSTEEVFDIADKSYVGPELPAKYQDLVLRNDWFLPGKAMKKKRRHRASHGKISFTDLSKSIATSWHNCEDNVKLFCAEVADIGLQKYRKEMFELQKQKSVDSIIASNKSQPSSTKKEAAKSKRVPSSKQRRVTPDVTPSHAHQELSSVLVCPEITPRSSLNLDPINVSSLPIEMSSFLMDVNSGHPLGARANQSMVDIQDDEIFAFWMSCGQCG